MHQVNARAPMHLWIVGVLSLLWNAMGVFDYLATKLRLQGVNLGLKRKQVDDLQKRFKTLQMKLAVPDHSDELGCVS